MDENKTDLMKLPKDIAAKARFSDEGGVEWPMGDARAAINALAEAGFIILGLDARNYDQGTLETPLSSFEPNDVNSEDVVAARDAALRVLESHLATSNKDDWLLITW